MLQKYIFYRTWQKIFLPCEIFVVFLQSQDDGPHPLSAKKCMTWAEISAKKCIFASKTNAKKCDKNYGKNCFKTTYGLEG